MEETIKKILEARGERAELQKKLYKKFVELGWTWDFNASSVRVFFSHADSRVVIENQEDLPVEEVLREIVGYFNRTLYRHYRDKLTLYNLLEELN